MTEELIKEWEILVGRLILKCGDIELKLLQLNWNMLLRTEVSGEISLMNTNGMATKAKRIIELCEKYSLDEPWKSKFKTLLNEIILLAQYRNLVAHNPLFMDVYLTDEGEIMSFPVIQSLRDNRKRINLDELVQHISSAQQICNQMTQIVRAAGDLASRRNRQ